MKLDYSVKASDIPEKRAAIKSKIAETLELLRDFVLSGKDVCGVSYSGNINTAYQHLIKARKEGQVPVKIMKRGKALFLVREV